MFMCSPLVHFPGDSVGGGNGPGRRNRANIHTLKISLPQIMFAGFFIKSTQIPIWLRWAQVPYSRLPHPPHLIATPHLQRPGSAGRSTSARSSLR